MTSTTANITKTKQMQKSFSELYVEAAKAPSPLQSLTQEITTLTKKSQITVRRWGAGTAYPSPLEQEAIAKHLGIPVHVLFPPRDKKKGAKK